MCETHVLSGRSGAVLTRETPNDDMEGAQRDPRVRSGHHGPAGPSRAAANEMPRKPTGSAVGRSRRRQPD